MTDDIDPRAQYWRDYAQQYVEADDDFDALDILAVTLAEFESAMIERIKKALVVVITESKVDWIDRQLAERHKQADDLARAVERNAALGQFNADAIDRMRADMQQQITALRRELVRETKLRRLFQNQLQRSREDRLLQLPRREPLRVTNGERHG
jgi:hypothetical protein